MQFDFKTMILMALIVFAPVLIAVVSINHHVGNFIRKVEKEEQEARIEQEKQASENEKSVNQNDDNAGVCE